MARRRRRKVGITATLIRVFKARRRKNATARRIAQKKAIAAQKAIVRDSRTTAGELRASGQLQWAGDGMPDSTVMEPVMEKGRHTGEWVPARVQPRKRAAGSGRPPAIRGMRAVRDSSGWYYVPIVKTDYQPDNRPIQEKRPGEGNWAQHSQKCGAPTKDKTPCERLGDCPIRSHQTWRKAHNRG